MSNAIRSFVINAKEKQQSSCLNFVIGNVGCTQMWEVHNFVKGNVAGTQRKKNLVIKKKNTMIF